MLLPFFTRSKASPARGGGTAEPCRKGGRGAASGFAQPFGESEAICRTPLSQIVCEAANLPAPLEGEPLAPPAGDAKAVEYRYAGGGLETLPYGRKEFPGKYVKILPIPPNCAILEEKMKG